MIRISPDLTLFPYTTLFRSGHRSLAVRSWRLSFAMVVAFVALQPALQTQQPAQPGVGVAPGSAGLPGEALRLVVLAHLPDQAPLVQGHPVAHLGARSLLHQLAKLPGQLLALGQHAHLAVPPY